MAGATKCNRAGPGHNFKFGSLNIALNTISNEPISMNLIFVEPISMNLIFVEPISMNQIFVEHGSMNQIWTDFHILYVMYVPTQP